MDIFGRTVNPWDPQCAFSQFFFFYVAHIRPVKWCQLYSTSKLGGGSVGRQGGGGEGGQGGGGGQGGEGAGCPGDLDQCMEACPSQIKVFQACVASCATRCH
jgi:hypothetical protein